MSDGCGAPVQGVDIAVGADEVVLTGKVSTPEGPVGGAFVRLLDSSGEFTAEVVSSPEGDFRFYAAPGTWTIRALHRSGNGQASVSADGPGVHPVSVSVA
ncbi:DUF1416 domain-containing protein [Saccharothrix australiensis]|uniref:Uncharacterized protein DUF1416 n=1 Tax=Saccharothrix australiensis TaxID=2072 RepID=A0A495VQ66_9PSEU|nr:DUF1416 domain-containing protein [Saccharothrix australiensis]RKT51539.1 uncharacterized protein DUF1416 [Saccharothrix australiensis]